ncbi:MAG: transposase [Burkholderiales bacterium]
MIATFLIKRSGLERTEARTGAVTLIQRFGSAANLNIHLHCLVRDGVYQCTEHAPVFQAATAPSIETLQGLLGKIIVRRMGLLTRRGLLIEEQGVRYLADIDADTALTPLQAARKSPSPQSIGIGSIARPRVRLDSGSRRSSNSRRIGTERIDHSSHYRLNTRRLPYIGRLNPGAQTPIDSTVVPMYGAHSRKTGFEITLLQTIATGDLSSVRSRGSDVFSCAARERATVQLTVLGANRIQLHSVARHGRLPSSPTHEPSE